MGDTKHASVAKFFGKTCREGNTVLIDGVHGAQEQ